MVTHEKASENFSVPQMCQLTRQIARQTTLQATQRPTLLQIIKYRSRINDRQTDRLTDRQTQTDRAVYFCVKSDRSLILRTAFRVQWRLTPPPGMGEQTPHFGRLI